MGIDDLVKMNSRIYDPMWDTQERISLRDVYDQKYGADIKYLPTSWIDIVGPLLDHVAGAFPDLQFLQVKEKFGRLRVYVDQRMPGLEHALETIASGPLIARDVYAERPSGAAR